MTSLTDDVWAQDQQGVKDVCFGFWLDDSSLAESLTVFDKCRFNGRNRYFFVVMNEPIVIRDYFC